MPTEKIEKSEIFKGKTILIMEDDPFISKVYSKWFKLAGSVVETAPDGALGLRILKEKKVDIVLLDLGMPGMNGYETLLEIRKIDALKDVPVIVLSNTTIEEGDPRLVEIRKAGVRDVLRKYETSLSELVACISAYFQVQ